MHAEFAVSPKPEEYLPFPHGRQFVSDADIVFGLYFPDPHFKHVELVFMPLPELYVPIAQLKQVSSAVACDTLLYLPSTHRLHKPEFEAASCPDQVPAAQDVHAAAEVIPDPVLYMPLMQLVHSPELLVTVYFPASQMPQVAEVPKYPLLHLHASTTLLYSNENEFGVQSVCVMLLPSQYEFAGHP